MHCALETVTSWTCPILKSSCAQAFRSWSNKFDCFFYDIIAHYNSKFLCQLRLCRCFGCNSTLRLLTVRYFRTQSFIVLVSTIEITLTTYVIAQDPNNVCKVYSFTLSHVCITLDKGVASRQHTAASGAYTHVHVAANTSCEHCMCMDRSGCCTATNSQGVLLPII